jgi:DNA helicase-2/ATP-dependent DNA helicase PcrA
MIPSSYQVKVLEFVQSGTGSAVIQAVAGSGKTTTLIQAMKTISSKGLCLMFNKKIQVEMEGKLNAAGIRNFSARTVHSIGFAALRNRFGSLVVNGSKVRDLCMRLMDAEQYSLYGSFVSKLVGLAKDSGFGIGGTFPAIGDFKAWMELVQHHDLEVEDDRASLEAGVEIGMQVLKESNRDLKTVDFSDQVYLPLLTGTKLPSFDWVLVDEAQDLSPLRQGIVRAVLSPSGRALLVGDRKQAIYGFAGADALAMDNLKAEFRATELPLSICYRCSKSVIRHAQPLVPQLEASASAPEGSVTSTLFADFVKETLVNLKGSDAILCRNNAPLIQTAFKLIASGVGCRIEGRDIGLNLLKLAKRWKVRTLRTLSDRLENYLERESQKLRAKNRESAVGPLEDKVDCLRALIGKCEADGKTTLDALESLILGMFSDGEGSQNQNLVTLCSVHKSKGLEWERVFLLGRKDFMPNKYATKDWMLEQEHNLEYVAITRAKLHLIEVEGVKDFFRGEVK